MIEFIKGNMTFITSSILLVGLFMGISALKKVPDQTQNQTNTDQEVSSTNIADNNKAVESRPAPKTITQNVVKAKTTTKTPTKTTIKKTSNPIPTPSIKTKIRQRSNDDDRDNE